MIITGLLNVIHLLLDKLLIFEIPLLPEELVNNLQEFFFILADGAGILANYVPLGFMMTAFFIVLAVDSGILIYKFVMWILRKIPVLGIS